MLLCDAVVAFLTDRTRKGRAKGTVRTYQDQLRLFQEFCKENRLNQVESIKERHIERYFSEMRHRPNRKWAGDVSPVTVRKRAIGLRTFFLFAKRERWIKYDLAKRIEIPRGGRRRPKALAPHQVTQFLDTARWTVDVNLLRDYTLIVLLLDSGLRLSEVSNLKLADVDLGRGLIRVRSGKWDNDRGTVMLLETAQLLRDYVGERAVESKYDSLEMPVFVGEGNARLSNREIYLLVKRRAKQAKLEREVSPHKLRHTWLTEYLNAGGRIHTAKELAGHGDVNTTIHYARTVSLVPVQQEHHKYSAVRHLVSSDIIRAFRLAKQARSA